MTSIRIFFTRMFDSISKIYNCNAMSIDNKTLHIYISNEGSVSLPIALYSIFTIIRIYDGGTAELTYTMIDILYATIEIM